MVRWENQHYVFVERGEGAFDMLPVSLGELQDGFQQILPNFDLGDRRLVLQNAYALLMKMKNSAEE